MVSRRPLHATGRIEGPFGRDIGGAFGSLVETLEAAAAERRQRFPERAELGSHRVVARDADRAVERGQHAGAQVERGDVVHGTRWREHVAAAAQDGATHLALGRGRAPVDREDLGRQSKEPAHPWTRRAITASSWHFRNPYAVTPRTPGASMSASYGSRMSTTASVRDRDCSSLSSRAFDA